MINKKCRIVSTTTLVEFDETLETGSAKVLCDKPYFIERVQKDDRVVWYGYNVNWIYFDGEWHVLSNGNWVICDTPEYERIFMELNIKKTRKEKIEKINDK